MTQLTDIPSSPIDYAVTTKCARRLLDELKWGGNDVQAAVSNDNDNEANTASEFG